MTTTNAERVSVTAILADLILLQSRNGLPMPVTLTARDPNSIASIILATGPALTAWTDALDATSNNMTHTYDDGHKIYGGSARRLGWSIQLNAYEDSPTESLPAETLAELEQVVAVAL